MTPSRMITAAESWEKIYNGFDTINFTSYDFNTVKRSLLDYLKLTYPENFNDYVESSQLIALLELFAYAAELLAYRIDMSVHEVDINSAQRKQSVLRLARLLSYTASRNLPLRGLVKVTSVTTSEDVRDAQGNSLANRAVRWGDARNPLWREQLFTVMDQVLVQPFGSPYKSFQVDDAVIQQYAVANVLETDSGRSAFRNGVLRFKTSVNGQDLAFEVVPADVDDAGVLERSPDPSAYLTVLYTDDGAGDASDGTGYALYVKQGTLSSLRFVFDAPVPNRALDVNLTGINDVDVWVQQLTPRGTLATEWTRVPTVTGVNLVFNDLAVRTKYEVETLEDDAVRLLFGDGDFSDIPTGIFNVWVRQSNSGGLTVPKSQVVDQPVTFLYTSRTGKQESLTLTFSLTAALTNAALSEDIEHVRSSAPAVYYSQNRMVNGEDYNSFLLQDPSILRLRAVNRTFAGQSRYLTWNDASGAYQNVKVFGDDLRLYYDDRAVTVRQPARASARTLVDAVLEPALSAPGVANLITYAFYTAPYPLSAAFARPRTRFIEDAAQLVNGVPLQEKTALQGALDRHWYGEPAATVVLNGDLAPSPTGTVYGVVSGDPSDDQLLYNSALKRVLRDPATGAYSDVGVAGPSGIQEAVARQKRFGIGFNPVRPSSGSTALALTAPSTVTSVEVITVEVTDADGSFSVYGSVSGALPAGQAVDPATGLGAPYLSPLLNFTVTGAPAVVGDAWIISLDGTAHPTVTAQVNLTGAFFVINEADLAPLAQLQAFDVGDPSTSWVLLVERTDDPSGSASTWTVTARDFRLVGQSLTSRFWYDADVVDPVSKLQVRDQLQVLKSNLDRTDGTGRPLGVSYAYDVVGDVRDPNGEVDPTALVVAPGDPVAPGSGQAFTAGTGAVQNPTEFLRFIGTRDYVYFSVDQASRQLTPVKATPYLAALTYQDDGYELAPAPRYVRRRGREGLDFMWQHYAANDRLLDPSPSNIIDAYVLTDGYYSAVRDLLRGLTTTVPVPPSSLELRNDYRELIQSKMISDTVVLHSGRVKLLFGALAEPELQATFRVVPSPTTRLTNDQLRAAVLDVIDRYFSIENWDFGQELYVTELCALVHVNLTTDISSVVLVPRSASSYFGDMYHVRSGPDEVFASAARLEDVEVITSLDRVTLKQKP